MKLWLCGITGDRLKDITEATECFDSFDGLVFVDHLSKDGTKELLESRKKEGKIISRPYVKQHSHSQNEILFSRHIKNGDWIFWIDSPERIKPFWLNQLRNDIKNFEKHGVGAVYFSGRPYLFQYFDYQKFEGSPHWGLVYPKGKIISFGDENKGLYLENKRNENPEDSYCLHPIKYWFCFNPSNECEIMYGKFGTEIYRKHEEIRENFRLYCESKLNLSLESLDELIQYMKKIESKEIIPDEFFLNFVEKEQRLSELYQLKVLNYNFMDERPQNPIGMHPRNKWSIKDHLKHGNGWINPDFKNLIEQYEFSLSK